MISPSGYDGAFKVETLSASVESFAAEFGAKTVSGMFSQFGRQIPVDGDIAGWDEVQMGRHLAPVGGADSPAVNQALAATISRSSALAHIKVYKDIPASKLFYHRAPGASTADRDAVIAAELKDLAKLIANTKEWMCTQALLGTITLNSTTIPGTTISTSVAFGNNTYTYSADWATASSDLFAEAKAIRESHIASGGSMPRICVTEPGVQAYINGNDKLTSLAQNAFGISLAMGSTHEDNFGRSDVRALGFDWKIAGGVYKPVGGAAQKFMSQDRGVFLPALEELDGVLGMAEGYGAIPVEGGAPVKAPSRGYYSYAVSQSDPVGVRLYAGWCGLPLILQPSNVTVATLS